MAAKRWLKRMAITLAVLAAIAAATLLWARHAYYAPGPLVEAKTIILPKGTGFRETVIALASEDVIDHPLIFKAAAALTGGYRHVKAGEYAFPAGITAFDVMNMLVRGDVVIHKLTLPEGWNVRETLAAIAAEPVLSGDLPANIPEGSLLPETYHFTYGDTRADLVERMQHGMAQVLAELWAARAPNLPLATPQEAVVMASIVEKETGVKSERPHVASVYLNRLRKNMRLQADPTVAYGVEQLTGKPLTRPLFLTDLGRESPYNTYLNPGLPPTPIANPGRAALQATLHPADTEDLYFVATGNGGHWFAKTEQEHEANVRKYREVQASRK
jgi:UPF0755 protein